MGIWLRSLLQAAPRIANTIVRWKKIFFIFSILLSSKSNVQADDQGFCQGQAAVVSCFWKSRIGADGRIRRLGVQPAIIFVMSEKILGRGIDARSLDERGSEQVL